MGDPARWFGFVTEGCFKYITRGISDERNHLTWFSFEGEFVGDYPACLDGGPALTTIEAMVPTRIIRVSGEQLVKRFSQDKKSMDLRCLVAEHLLSQARARYTDLHRATPLERYELLLQRCPGIVEHLALQDLASFLRPFGSKRQSRAPLHHAADAFQNSQRNLFRSTKIVFLQKFTETSFRVSPSPPTFPPVPRALSSLFRNFAANT